MKLVSNLITIRDFKHSDLQDFYNYAKKPTVGPPASWRPHPDIKTSKKILTGFIFNQENFAIILNDESKVVGHISIYQETFRKKVEAIELGFVLDDDYWGKGIMTNSIVIVLEELFKKRKKEIVYLVTLIDNVRCQKLCERLHFICEGTFRKYKKLYNGLIVDVKHYSMTLEEYEKNLENGVFEYEKRN